MIASFQLNVSQHCWAEHILRVWPPGWRSFAEILKLEQATPNMSQHDGQTHATFCAQEC